MALAKLKIEKYSYADYLTWDDKKRWEIIEGNPYDMSPAPRTKHQRILGNLFFEFECFFRKKKCNVFIAPFDVRLPDIDDADDEETETVVQPDISIFCDPKKIDEKGAKGAPDLVVEILSEFNAKKDLLIKLTLYQKHKVKEYWIIDPDENALFVYILDKNNMYSAIHEYHENDIVRVVTFPKLKINLKDIFE